VRKWADNIDLTHTDGFGRQAFNAIFSGEF
jgi:hypothetical protein